MLKVIIVILFLLVLLSIFGGAIFLMKDQGDTKSKRTYYALTCRITSVVLLISAVSYGIWTGELSLNAPWHDTHHEMNQNNAEDNP